jgi:hypothetical protein
MCICCTALAAGCSSGSDEQVATTAPPSSVGQRFIDAVPRAFLNNTSGSTAFLQVGEAKLTPVIQDYCDARLATGPEAAAEQLQEDFTQLQIAGGATQDPSRISLGIQVLMVQLDDAARAACS